MSDLLAPNSPDTALAPATDEELKPRCDLTYKILKGLTLRGANARQSLFNGTLLRDCNFREVDLSRCDLEQVRIQDCSFVDVDFSNAEMNSGRFDRCHFTKSKFDDALITDSIWRHCDFQSCSFKKAAIQSSTFEECDLIANDFQGASVQLNTFLKCRFKDTTLGDCTFLNQLLISCKYDGVRINAESIGTLFGISERDILNLGLVYLGQQVVSVNAVRGLLKGLEKEYVSRRWRFMYEMLRLNFKRQPAYLALSSCFEALIWPATFGMPIKAADIAFFEKVIMEMHRSKELPGLPVLAVPDRINEFIKTSAPAQKDPSSEMLLKQLASRLRMILFEMLHDLYRGLRMVDESDDERLVRAKFVFRTKPSFEIAQFLNEMVNISGFKKQADTYLLRESNGSYIAVLETTMLTLAALQMGLWLLNGCAAQLIDLKGRVKVMTQKRLPKVVQERALLAEQDIPKWLAVAVHSIYAKLGGETSHLIRSASDLHPSNLKRIEIEEKPKGDN